MINIFASILEQEARNQITRMGNSPAFTGNIAIMPDAHAGKGCVVGFTGRFGSAVIPNIVGVDIGCGVICYKLKSTAIGFESLDAYIRNVIPLGCTARKFTDYEKLAPQLAKKCLDISYKIEDEYKKLGDDKKLTPPSLQIGTLGGGNHFIEVAQDPEGNLYLLIHSGSRNLGLKVCNHFQAKAKDYIKKNKLKVDQDLEYLPMDAGGEDYIYWMHMTQQYAQLNRRMMLQIILNRLDEQFESSRLVESVHNYIGKDGIVRKGAISAYENENVVIPLNMADGTILGVGKSNADYNFSAPHGAGRLHSRSAMFKMLATGQYSIEDFKQSMEGIFSTSVTKDTFDESKFAYKDAQTIIEEIGKTVEIKTKLKPVYNLKASEDPKGDRAPTLVEISSDMAPGEALDALGKQLNMSRQKLALHLAMPEEMLSEIIAGTKPISRSLAKKIAYKFNCNQMLFLPRQV